MNNFLIVVIWMLIIVIWSSLCFTLLFCSFSSEFSG